MPKRDHSVLANVSSLLLCGLLAGVVVAAAAFPAIAMSGLAAKAGAKAFGDLPVELTLKTSPQISYVYASDGKTLLALMYDENRRNVRLDEIAPIMQKAIVAAEDHKFYEHNGVDMKGIARAFVANKQAGETEQGASTLTMQFVRLAVSYSTNSPNKMLTATEDTAQRKLLEIKNALAVEERMTKEQILEGYLNMAFYGNGAFGIYAASQVYFNKEPKDLTAPEAAFLAGLVKSPSNYNPVGLDNAIDPDGFKKGKDRRDWVIGQMHEIGAIDDAGQTAALKTELTIVGKRAPKGCFATIKAHWGFFCDFLTRWWMQQDAFGANEYERERALNSGGYKIISSLDIVTQESAKKTVEKQLKTGSKLALMSASIEPGSGKVRSLAVNRNFKIDDPKNPQNGVNTDPKKRALGIRGTYPNTANPLMTGDDYGYQFGSTFKIFTLVAALERGMPLDTNIKADSTFVSKFPVGSGPASCGGYWCPGNANPGWMNGVRNMWSGFGRSVNTYFAQLIQRVGPKYVIDAATRMGLKFRGDATKCCSDAYYAKHPDAWGAFTLGVTSNTPLETANAYATLAADGTYCEPTPVESITDAGGKVLDVGNPRCKKVIETDVARAAVDAARCPLGDSSLYGKCDGGTATNVRGIVGRQVAGKSGTTDENRTAAFVSMTPQLAVASILADPDYTLASMPTNSHPIANPASYIVLRDAMKGKPVQKFQKPENQKIVYGTPVKIPSIPACATVAAAQSILKNSGFQVDIDTKPIDSACPAGTFAGTNPTGRAQKNGLVVIQISNGKKAPTVPPGPGAGGGPGGPGGGRRVQPDQVGFTLTCPPICRNEERYNL
ncbi:transglycosylase domain-containing protein [Allocatelliglobosispora scoriae]|nr:transglycosylase domain-containing protein [Allocatelliglobosispora scoriae]